MTKYTREDVMNFLADVEATGIVYNTEFNIWKSRASDAIYSALKVAKNNTYLSDGYDGKKYETDLYYSLISPTVTNFPSKKLANELKAHDTPFYQEVKKVANDWKEISDTFKILKGQVVKGRKPSDKPRQTPERTLENTGTCPCCGRNIKLMSNGTMVEHGFTIKSGFRNGNCFGVGFKPWEVSPEGAIAMIKSDESRIAHDREFLINLQTTNTLKVKARGSYGVFPKFDLIELTEENSKEFERHRSIQIANTENLIEFLMKSIEINTNRVENWKPGVLPDQIK